MSFAIRPNRRRWFNPAMLATLALGITPARTQPLAPIACTGPFARNADEAALMAAGQRPITEAALTEKSGKPAWKALPSYFIYGDGDRNIPAQALGFMAERAGSKRTIVVEGASHVVMVSQPQPVAELIEEAAQ